MNRHKRDFAIDPRVFKLIALAALIGVLAVFAADALLALIRFFTNLFFFQTLSLTARSPAGNTLGLWVIVLPVIGGLIVGLMARFGSEKIRGHGIPEAIEAILFGKSTLSPKVAVLKPLSSGIVIGSGGPFGAEGPIIMTGGSIGSLIGQYFHLTAAERKTLLVAGATAGMTAVFGTPVAAVLLAVELLLFELRPRSLLPVAIACAVAGFVRTLVLDAGPLFPVQTATADLSMLGGCLIAGLLSGMLCSGLSFLLYRIEDLFGHLPLHWMWWPALGGLVIGLGGYLEPRALGIGFDVISDLLHNHILLSAALALLLVKALIWVVALGSGTSGGVLAPLLMLGAGLGAVLGHILPGGHTALWPLVCMAATLAGVLGAPMTAVIFALGLSHDTNALLPVLLAVTVAYGFTILVAKRSIMTEKIARRGRHIHREYAVDPLESHDVAEVMTHQVQTLDATLTVAEVMASHFGAGQVHRAFPVTHQGRLLGVLDRNLLSGIPGESLVAELLRDTALHFALPGETCRLAASRLISQGIERLPVVADTQSLRLVGIISRSDILKTSLHFHDQEVHRETMRRLPWREGRSR
jgi:H+/Cl- antiporter ClcA